VARGVGPQIGTIDRDVLEPRQPSRMADAQHPTEQRRHDANAVSGRMPVRL